MVLPGSGSAVQWTVNTSYDTLRNEFLVPGGGYNGADGNPNQIGRSKILRFTTGSTGIEYVGYYQVSCSYNNLTTGYENFYSTIESCHYDPDGDLIWYTYTTPTTAEVSGSILKQYKISNETNSDILVSSYPANAYNYNGWGQHSPAYHIPSKQLFVREAYQSASVNGVLDFAVIDCANYTYTYPSQSLYRKTGLTQLEVGFNSQVMNILIPEKDAYAHFNSEDIWGIDVYNYSPKFQISGSVNSTGYFNDTMTVNTRVAYDNVSENFWISFSALDVFNTYDLSAI